MLNQYMRTRPKGHTVEAYNSNYVINTKCFIKLVPNTLTYFTFNWRVSAYSSSPASLSACPPRPVTSGVWMMDGPCMRAFPLDGDVVGGLAPWTYMLPRHGSDKVAGDLPTGKHVLNGFRLLDNLG